MNTFSSRAKIERNVRIRITEQNVNIICPHDVEVIQLTIIRGEGEGKEGGR